MEIEAVKKRIEWIDTAKGIGILLVILGHCYLDGKFIFWFCSFHMPLFFFLSGYTFSEKKNYQCFLAKKIKALLIPYLFFVLITMFWNGMLAITHNSSYNVIEIIKLYLIQKRYTLLWFITCLFFAEQIMYWLNVLERRFQVRFFWIISSGLGLFTFWLYRTFVKIDLPWNIDLSILAVAFMCWGKWVSTVFSQRIQYGWDWKYCIVIVVCIIVSWCNFSFWGKVDWYSDQFGNPILFFGGAITGVISVVHISQNLNFKYLMKLGKNSLLFYGLHRIVIDLIYVIYYKVGIRVISGSWTSFLLAFVNVFVVIGILTPVAYFILKYMPWCLGKSK